MFCMDGIKSGGLHFRAGVLFQCALSRASVTCTIEVYFDALFEDEHMAYLNQQEREKLLQELVKLNNVPRARGKLRRMDPKVRLAYMRNMQQSGEYATRFDLFGLGTVVTLIERGTEEKTATDKAGAAAVRFKPEFTLSEVIVEPMPENKT
jgi:hypothetical protein